METRTDAPCGAQEAAGAPKMPECASDTPNEQTEAPAPVWWSVPLDRSVDEEAFVYVEAEDALLAMEAVRAQLDDYDGGGRDELLENLVWGATDMQGPDVSDYATAVQVDGPPEPSPMDLLTLTLPREAWQSLLDDYRECHDMYMFDEDRSITGAIQRLLGTDANG